MLQNHYSAQQVAPLPFREFACLGRECEIRDCRGLVEMFEAVNQGPRWTATLPVSSGTLFRNAGADKLTRS